MDLTLRLQPLYERDSITVSAFAEPTTVSVTYLDTVTSPICLLPNSEGLKEAQLLLPGGWMCLKRIFLRSPLSILVLSWYCPSLLTWSSHDLLYSFMMAPSSV